MKSRVLLILYLCLMVSCAEESPKAHLLEFKVNDRFYSYRGYAFRYNDIVKGVSKAYDWHIFNLNQIAIYMEAYDTTFKKLVFSYPAFQAKFTDEMSQSQVETYEATSGVFRLLGEEMGDIRGDFYFTMKNIANPDDSVMIKDGYFRIWLEKQDRIFLK